MPKLVLPQGPMALSLSGGGSKGAYSVGVIQYLHEVQKVRDYRIVYGTSTGALIASMVGAFSVTGDPQFIQSLITIYRTVEDSAVLAPRYPLPHGVFGEMGGLAAALAAGGESVYEVDGLRDLIERFIPNKVWQRILRAGKRATKPIEIGLACINLQTGKNEIITNRSATDIKLLKEAVLASASFPVFMPPVDSSDGYQRLDGGVKDFNPIEHVFASDLVEEVEGIVAISLDQPSFRKTSKRYEALGDILDQTLALMTHGVFETDIRSAQLWNVLLRLKALLGVSEWRSVVNQLPPDAKAYVKRHARGKRYLPIAHVVPQRKITMKPLEFKQPAMRRFVDHGFRDARKLFED